MKIQEIMNKIAKDPKSMFLTEREVDRFIKEIMQYKKSPPNRESLKYATEQLDRNNITYKVCNDTTGQINCYFANGTVLTFYAGTGKIKGYEYRGIKSFLRICKAESERK